MKKNIINSLLIALPLFAMVQETKTYTIDIDADNSYANGGVIQATLGFNDSISAGRSLEIFNTDFTFTLDGFDFSKSSEGAKTFISGEINSETNDSNHILGVDFNDKVYKFENNTLIITDAWGEGSKLELELQWESLLTHMNWHFLFCSNRQSNICPTAQLLTHLCQAKSKLSCVIYQQLGTIQNF